MPGTASPNTQTAQPLDKFVTSQVLHTLLQVLSEQCINMDKRSFQSCWMQETAHLANDIGMGRQGGHCLDLMQAPAHDLCRSEEDNVPALGIAHVRKLQATALMCQRRQV